MEDMGLKRAVESIEMPEDMAKRIISRSATAHHTYPCVHRKRGAVILLAAAICVMLAVPVLAATTEPVYQILYRFAPTAAQLFQPVCRSDEDQGIRMDVISAQIDGNTAKVYLSLRDLEGDRVDETIDLYDSYSIRRPFDSSAHCELAGFDAETKTAIFLVTITEFGHQTIEGDKVTFSLREFLSHKQIYDGVEVPVDWAAVPEVSELWEDAALTGYGGLEEIEDGSALMLPDKTPLAGFSVQGIDITGIGFVNGKLHVQTAVQDYHTNDNHGYFYLVDENGNKVQSIYSVSARDSSSGCRVVDYQEEVFDVSRDEAERYRLMGDFVVSGQMTRGNWRVTFPLEQMDA